MVSETVLLLTLGPALLLAAVAVWLYHTTDFTVQRRERWFIKAGIILHPLYALLEFKLLPGSVLPEALLAVTGVLLAYGFHGFRVRVID